MTLNTNCQFFSTHRSNNRVSIQRLMSLVRSRQRRRQARYHRRRPSSSRHHRHHRPTKRFPTLSVRYHRPFSRQVTRSNRRNQSRRVSSSQPRMPSRGRSNHDGHHTHGGPRRNLKYHPRASSRLDFQGTYSQDLQARREVTSLSRRFTILQGRRVSTQPRFGRTTSTILLREQARFRVKSSATHSRTYSLARRGLLSQDRLRRNHNTFIFNQKLKVPHRRGATQVMFRVFSNATRKGPIRVSINSKRRSQGLRRLLVRVLIFLRSFNRSSTTITKQGNRINVISTRTTKFPRGHSSGRPRRRRRRNTRPRRQGVHITSRRIVSRPPRGCTGNTKGTSGFMTFFVCSRGLV